MLRGGRWIFWVLTLWSIIAPVHIRSVAASETLQTDGNILIFSYDQSSVSQSVQVNLSGKSTLTAQVRAKNTQYGPDKLAVGIQLKGPGGGGIYSHSTGWVDLGDNYQDISISISADGVGLGGWNQAATAEIFILGDDAEFWAGNYGPSVESASLKLDGQELLVNSDFSSTSSWSSNIGWQSCANQSGNQPCVLVSAPPTSTTTTTTAPEATGSLFGTANEGWDLTLTAPFGVFTAVEFASYGNPDGETLGSCNAENSVQKVAEAFIGQSSATIAANNSVFGDPCGGTYKRLNVRLVYSGVAPTTTTSTTTTTTTAPPPTCGPYETQTVTGQINGAVWGSNPYTDDSTFSVAAVHAGLIDVGETAVIEAYDIQYYTEYPGTFANGATTSDWMSGWCGYKIRIYAPSTTTTSTTTTTTSTTTTTTEAPATTTESPLPPEEETTEPPQETTIPVETTEVPVESTEPPSETTDAPVSETTTPEEPETTVVEENEPETTEPETTLPEPETDAETEEEEARIEEIVQSIDDPELQAAVEELLAAEEITSELIEKLVSNESFDELTQEQIDVIVEALNEASDDVKETFEEEINIFSGEFDNYVPSGSKVTVAERRIIVAATSIIVVAPSVVSGGGGRRRG